VAASAVLVIEHPGAWRISATGNELLSGSGPDQRGAWLGSLEILGKSTVDRTIERLENADVRVVAIVAPKNLSHFVAELSTRHAGIEVVHRAEEQWPVEAVLRERARNGVDQLLLVSIGAHVECDITDVLRFHRETGGRVTRLQGTQGPLDFWVIGAGLVQRARMDCHRPWEAGALAAPYLVRGYMNRLRDARDLRRLVVDAFLTRCATRPGGQETKPGVWMEDGARVHRTARVLAPAYIGCGARVRASAVITRCSNLERHCDVGSGTVVDDSAVLAYTRLGKGLNVSHGVVDGDTFVDLRRKVGVEVDDPRLLGRVAGAGASGMWHRPEPVERSRPSEECNRLSQRRPVASTSLNFLEDEV
jgi:hypothetical protein